MALFNYDSFPGIMKVKGHIEKEELTLQYVDPEPACGCVLFCCLLWQKETELARCAPFCSTGVG